jgi:hypothetical protein
MTWYWFSDPSPVSSWSLVIKPMKWKGQNSCLGVAGETGVHLRSIPFTIEPGCEEKTRWYVEELQRKETPLCSLFSQWLVGPFRKGTKFSANDSSWSATSSWNSALMPFLIYSSADGSQRPLPILALPDPHSSVSLHCQSLHSIFPKPSLQAIFLLISTHFRIFSHGVWSHLYPHESWTCVSISSLSCHSQTISQLSMVPPGDFPRHSTHLIFHLPGRQLPSLEQWVTQDVHHPSLPHNPLKLPPLPSHGVPPGLEPHIAIPQCPQGIGFKILCRYSEAYVQPHVYFKPLLASF